MFTIIKRIFTFIILALILVFILIWLLGGGWQNIKATVSHYRDPLKYHSIIDYFFQIGSTTGETFKLPGTPSTYPTVSMPDGTATTSYGPTTVYTPGSNGGDGMQ